MMLKYASATILSAEIGDRSLTLRTAHRATFGYQRRPGYLYVRTRAISSRCNDNFDDFPAEEIRGDEVRVGYRTFIGKPAFVNHVNDNHRRARGVIVDAALHEDVNPDGTPDVWVELLHEVDAAKFPKLAEAVLNGEITTTSMGCDVEYSVCSFCGNRASTPLEYCAHIPRLKGKRIRRITASGQSEDVLVREICHGLRFFENSFLVEDPADPTAYVLDVDASQINKAASRTAAGKLPKHPYQVTLPDGNVVTNHSTREYNHVAIGQAPDPLDYPEHEREYRPPKGQWTILNWSAKPDQAAKAARPYSQYRNQRVVPVDNPRGDPKTSVKGLDTSVEDDVTSLQASLETGDDMAVRLAGKESGVEYVSSGSLARTRRIVMEAAINAPVPTEADAIAHAERLTRNARNNGDDRGSSYARRARSEWLIAHYGNGKFCGCMWCGRKLTMDTVSADRFYPGSEGGSYRRENVGPACVSCNSGRAAKDFFEAAKRWGPARQLTEVAM
jgi:hypothetical protein